MKKAMIILGIVIFVLLMILFLINLYVVLSTKNQIIKDYSNIKDIDCILVLGAKVENGKPSPILQDRLLEGIDLYKKGVSKKIIMSGDNGSNRYDEVNVMKSFAIERGVPSEDIFMDHAGFSTYESIYRAKEIFGVKKMVIVTQKYHIYRALYIANQFGIEAYGSNSDPRKYVGATYREVREVLGRNKDFVKCIFKPKPKYLGESIPVSGNGDVTNDKNSKTK